MIKAKRYPDGIWMTSEHEYKDRRILIKSKPGHGMKGHVFLPGNRSHVHFTLRFAFIKPELLLNKIKEKIDKLSK